MGTKDNPGVYDCYTAAEPDEPLFVLLARDKFAPALVWLWSTLRELDGEDADKIQEARWCVDTMIDWARKHNRHPVGLAQPTLVGLMDLVRTNHALIDMLNHSPQNERSTVEDFKIALARLDAETGRKVVDEMSPFVGLSIRVINDKVRLEFSSSKSSGGIILDDLVDLLPNDSGEALLAWCNEAKDRISKE